MLSLDAILRTLSAELVRRGKADSIDAALSMDKLIDDLSNPQFKDTLAETLKVLSGNHAGHSTLQSYLKQLEEKADGASVVDRDRLDVDAASAGTLEQMSAAAHDMQGMEAEQASARARRRRSPFFAAPALSPRARARSRAHARAHRRGARQVEAFGEAMMTNMIGEFEKLGEKEDFNTVVDGMMRQLLDKELMYVPMKQVCDKYPEWLAEKVEQLSREDYLRFGAQYQCVSPLPPRRRPRSLSLARPRRAPAPSFSFLVRPRVAGTSSASSPCTRPSPTTSRA